VTRRRAREHLLEVGLELAGGSHRAGVGHVMPVVPVARAGNVAVDLVERIGFARVAVGGAGVDEQHGRIAEVGERFVNGDPHFSTYSRRERSRRSHFLPAVNRSPFACPFRETAIEDRDRIVSEVTEHPP
jgi:hypothetical protein